jgi:hypothetical protein
MSGYYVNYVVTDILRIPSNLLSYHIFILSYWAYYEINTSSAEDLPVFSDYINNVTVEGFISTLQKISVCVCVCVCIYVMPFTRIEVNANQMGRCWKFPWMLLSVVFFNISVSFIIDILPDLWYIGVFF